MIKVHNYKKNSIAVINCAGCPQALQKVMIGLMVKFGCPYIAENIYLCNYCKYVELYKQFRKLKVDIEYTSDFKSDYTLWAKISSEKQISLEKYLGKINQSINKEYGVNIFDHQTVAAKWLVDRNAAILADGMGLGKTFSAILSLPKQIPVLIISPANAKHVWRNQFKRWTGRESEILFGRKSFRFPEPGEVLISNYDILPEEIWVRIPKTLKKEEAKKLRDLIKKRREEFLKSCPEGMVVIMDEGHRLKNPSSIRSKRMHYINAECKKKFGKVWILTGTPVNQGGEDLYGLLYAIDAVEETFGNRPNFIYQFGGKSTGFGIIYDKPKSTAVNFMANTMLRRTADQVFDLPPVRQEEIYIETTEEVKAACKEFEDKCSELGINLEEAIKMARDPGSPMYVHFMRLKALLAIAKIPAVDEIVEDYEEAKECVIVACTHLKPLEYFGARKGWAKIDGSVSSAKRDEIERDFQDGKYKGLALSILAGGEALTLTYCNQMICMDSAFTPGPEAQAKKRIDRPGQTKPVLYKRILVDHPLEDRILQIVERKISIIESTVDLLSNK